jgi:hypothetical protein
VRSLRLAFAGAALVAAAAPLTQHASAMTCPPPVVSTACWAWGTACGFVPQGGKPDLYPLLCTSVA